MGSCAPKSARGHNQWIPLIIHFATDEIVNQEKYADAQREFELAID